MKYFKFSPITQCTAIGCIMLLFIVLLTIKILSLGTFQVEEVVDDIWDTSFGRWISRNIE